MENPKRRLVKEIYETGNRACHYPVVGVDDEEEWAEEFLDQHEEEPEFDMDCQPSFTFSEIKKLLPEGVSMEDCFCTVYFDEDHLVIKVLQDLGANPAFKSELKEHAELTEKKRLEQVISLHKDSMNYAERELKAAQVELEKINAKTK